MWDLPALAGGFFTPGPPGESWAPLSFVQIIAIPSHLASLLLPLASSILTPLPGFSYYSITQTTLLPITEASDSIPSHSESQSPCNVLKMLHCASWPPLNPLSLPDPLLTHPQSRSCFLFGASACPPPQPMPLPGKCFLQKAVPSRSLLQWHLSEASWTSLPKSTSSTLSPKCFLSPLPSFLFLS